ncbi:sporulation protein [Paenactinomyces guangxiensis]|uniref:Sporulation protein n=1 Tax=Paenactinomyces guangxiensis TaxID=1490290 RepID=A0A7W2A7Q7_9BACL|nr:sporulation protein [Paenactinomyces guangxiensis]MBA4493850.1 sporulation protein [Paenactinomyces guangxiensis]MBH8591316.1 sporulation protein [Paenactinomyces guangxiensis]
MLKQFFASLGVGAAKIDLILDRDSVIMGEEVTGKIVLKGGDVKQLIEGLNVEFRLSSSYKKGDHHVNINENIATIPVTSEIFTVYPDQIKEYPFSFICPRHLPVSSINTRYYFQTHLEIKEGLDAQDRDFVDVYATGIQNNFLQGFKALGFVHQGEGYSGSRDQGYQIIQFRPTNWLRGQYDEIVFMYQPHLTQNSVSGYFELDKRTTGILGKIADELDLDEKKGRFYFDAEDLASPDKAAQTIRQFIISNSEGLYGM